MRLLCPAGRPFRRVIIETSGVARPAPIVQTLLSDPLLPHHYSLDAIVATVDGEHGLRGPEALQQVAAADTLVVTKPDLADSRRLDALEAELARLNPAARTIRASFGDIDAEVLLSSSDHDPRTFSTQSNGSAHGPAALVLTLDGAIDWTAFGIWLTMLLHARGKEILRIKGLLDVGGEGPLLVSCVQHAVYPPVHLDSWPDEDRRSRLVFIGHDLDGSTLETSLRAFDRAAARQ